VLTEVEASDASIRVHGTTAVVTGRLTGKDEVPRAVVKSPGLELYAEGLTNWHSPPRGAGKI